MKKIMVGIMLTAAITPLFADQPVAVSASPLSGVVVYPNPWKATDNKNSLIKFKTLPDGATVKIFTLSGRLVRTLSASSGEAGWDRQNTSGDTVASGIYLYLIQDSQGDKTTGKIAVIE